jgi:hypothetical protein
MQNFKHQKQQKEITMKKKTIILTAVLLVLSVEAFSLELELEEKVQPLKLSGFRIGATYILGETGKLELQNAVNDSQVVPVISQFGWQFEWQYPSGVGGMAAVVEVVPLIGGLNLGTIIPSVTTVIGLRSGSGYELGGGPMVSLGRIDDRPAFASGFVVAAGKSISFGKLYVPFNFVYTMGKTNGADGTSHRFTLVTGFAL